MKNLLAFMKPNSAKISTPSETPVTDSSLEQWGSRTVVDAKICRNLEKDLQQARTLLKNVAENTVQKGIEVMNTVKSFIDKKDEQVRAFRTTLKSKGQTVNLTTNVRVLSKVDQKRSEMKDRIKAYVKRVEAKGQIPTIQKIQNSFSPDYPSKALIQELMKELGL